MGVSDCVCVIVDGSLRLCSYLCEWVTLNILNCYWSLSCKLLMGLLDCVHVIVNGSL